VKGQNNKSLLKEVMINLPDSVFRSNDQVQHNDILNVWNNYDSLAFLKNETSLQNNYTIHSVNYPDNELWYSLDTANLYFIIENGFRIQIKIFLNKIDTVVAISSVSSSEGEPRQNYFIGFYKYINCSFLNYTDKILDSFDFAKDNFSKKTINYLQNYYGEYPHIPEHYIYNLTSSDTIVIDKNIYDFFCCDTIKFQLDMSHTDGEFFKREYIFRNSKLIPLGRVRKNMKEVKQIN
jgi:hypothetical protein